MTDDITNIEAARARLRALREQRLAERIEAGEIVSVALSVVVGTESQLAAAVEQAKADKLKELRAAGETREVVFDVTEVVTGVCRPGENAGAPVWKPAPRPVLPPDEVVEEEAVREEAQPPLVETPISVQIRACRDDDDPGEIVEGYFSVDGRYVTVTDANGRHVGSRAMREGEDARVVAKKLLREKTVPEEEFNRRLDYPRGWA